MIRSRLLCLSDDSNLLGLCRRNLRVQETNLVSLFVSAIKAVSTVKGSVNKIIKVFVVVEPCVINHTYLLVIEMRREDQLLYSKNSFT